MPAVRSTNLQLRPSSSHSRLFGLMLKRPSRRTGALGRLGSEYLPPATPCLLAQTCGTRGLGGGRGRASRHPVGVPRGQGRRVGRLGDAWTARWATDGPGWLMGRCTQRVSREGRGRFEPAVLLARLGQPRRVGVGELRLYLAVKPLQSAKAVETVDDARAARWRRRRRRRRDELIEPHGSGTWPLAACRLERGHGLWLTAPEQPPPLVRVGACTARFLKTGKAHARQAK